MKFSGLLQQVLAVVLVVTGAAAGAEEPCAPFEGGRVDAALLQVMRDAAGEGRLYRVAPGESKVGFCVRHFPFQEFRGEFTRIVGGLALPPDPQGEGQALLLIHTTDMESSNKALDEVVRGHEFMDTERFPEILFVGRAFHWLDAHKGHIHGELTLRGRTQPVVFSVGIDALEEDPDGGYDRIYLHGTGQVNRYNFDMRSYRFFVSETVRLCLSVELVPWGS
ncbi:MAG: YceI family protein [Gammaproteobacteria bacterium]